MPKRKRRKKRVATKKKLTTTKKILIAAIIAINLFTIACLFIQYTTQTDVSSTLIEYWFGFWTIEIFSMAGIKITKVRTGVKEEDETEPVADNTKEDEDA